MNDNIVKLIFSAVASGSGWSDVSGKLKGLLTDSGKLAQGVGALGPAFGAFGSIAGRAIRMLMHGGVWGFAAEGIKLLIEKTGIFKDKSEEIKKSLAEQKKAHDALLASITTGYNAALAKLDAEARKRKEMIELTNRQTKAQLELRRAQAIMSGDRSTASFVEDELSKLDGRNAVAKADVDVKAAEGRVKAAQDALAAAQKKAIEAEGRLAKAEDKAEKDAIRPNAGFTGFGPGGMAAATALRNAGKRYMSEDVIAVDAAQKEADAAEEKVDAARQALEVEMQGLRDMKKARDVARLEQEAAEKKAVADREKARMAEADARAKAEKDAQEALDRKHRQNLIDSANERRKQEEQDRKDAAQADRDQLAKLQVEKHRKNIQLLGQEADYYRQRLEDAHAAVARAKDAYRNSGDIDQAGERRAKRREEYDEGRYQKDVERLQKRKDWRTTDKLSNRERATRDRLLAEEDEKKSISRLAEIQHLVEKLVQKIEEATAL